MPVASHERQPSPLEQFEATLACAYHRLLVHLPWDDPIVVEGLREGLNKFLSNAHLALLRGSNKYYKTHLISAQALEQLRRGRSQGLVWEHVVPKRKYIQGVCEEEARAGVLTIAGVQQRLHRYWRIAAITRDEDRRLHPRNMPGEWDGISINARYEAVGLELVANPFFESCLAKWAAERETQ